MGTPWSDACGTDTGKVTSYEKTLYTPGWNGPRFRNHCEDGAHFGQAIALDGNLAVVGAPLSSLLATQSGAAFVFNAW